MMPPCELWAPEEYWLLTEHDRNDLRCGPGRGILENLIPDIWRFGWPFVPPLRITPVCAIHDYCYATGPDTHDWKATADRAFRNNMIRLVEAAGGPKIVKWVRRRKCNLYYYAVRDFGGPAFWSGRNPDNEMSESCVVNVWYPIWS